MFSPKLWRETCWLVGWTNEDHSEVRPFIYCKTARRPWFRDNENDVPRRPTTRHDAAAVVTRTRPSRRRRVVTNLRAPSRFLILQMPLQFFTGPTSTSKSRDAPPVTSRGTDVVPIVQRNLANVIIVTRPCWVYLTWKAFIISFLIFFFNRNFTYRGITTLTTLLLFVH